MCSIGLNFEYSRMRVHSLSSGCEIAPFFVRYMATMLRDAKDLFSSQMHLLRTRRNSDSDNTSSCDFGIRAVMYIPCHSSHTHRHGWCTAL